MIRAIYFDAVGTLIHPQPSAAEVYFDVGRRHGSNLPREAIAQRFRAAFDKQEELDRRNGWTSDEHREGQRWRSIVAEVLDDVNDPDACFAELYQHFAKPSAWRCDSAVGELLDALRAQGQQLGIASNYDHRLRTVVVGLEPLRSIQHVIISSEVGWRKPASAFFAAVVRQAGVPATGILYVGDDRANDYDAALAAGLQAVLVDPLHGAPIRSIIAHACHGTK